ncbi:MAG: hypothetical protein O3B13_00640 [Planctomycetota bacterium]|nr:hypothetical protein [Planctomycetota bacterium]
MRAETLPTLDQIEAARKEAEASTTLDDSTKKAIADLAIKSVESIRSAARSRGTLQALQQDAANAADDVTQVLEELKRPIGQFFPSVAPGATPEEVQSEVTRAEAELVEARKRLAGMEEVLGQRAARRPKLPDLITQSQKELAEFEKQLAVSRPEGEAAELTRAREAFVMLHREELRSSIALLGQEGPLYDATARLLTVRRDLAQRTVTDAERRLEEWQKARSEALKEQARKQAQEALETLKTAHPEVGEIARRNQELTEINQDIVAQLETATRDRDEIRKRVEQLDSEFTDLQTRAEAAHFTEAIGHLLRSHYSRLPGVARYQDGIAERDGVITELNLDLIQYERERRNLVDLENATNESLKQIRVGTGTEAGEIRRQVEELLSAQSVNLSTLTLNAASCLNMLVSLDSAERNLIEQVHLQHDYIAEHVLWVQSATEMYRTPASAWLTSARQLMHPESWYSVGRLLRIDIGLHSVTWLAGAISWILLITIRGRWRRALIAIGMQARKSTVTEFRPTASAAVLTAAIALPWPVMFLLLGWRLDVIRGGTGSFTPPRQRCRRLVYCIWYLKF